MFKRFGQPLTLYGEGTQTRSFCYVDDLVQGFLKLMEGEHTGPMNLGNPGEFTIRQLAELVRERINPDLEFVFEPLPQDDPLQRQPVIALAQQQLGWQPLVAIAAGLDRTIADFRARLKRSRGGPGVSAPVLVTGAAGFIGAAVVERLLQQGQAVVGIDNLNSYYDPALKQARLQRLEQQNSSKAWRFQQIDVADAAAIADLFEAVPVPVVHLAAQAGVRYSLENPAAYVQSNLVGFGHILEGCRHQQVEHLVYASSSSVYGGNRNLPFRETQAVNHPVSLTRRQKKPMS